MSITIRSATFSWDFGAPFKADRSWSDVISEWVIVKDSHPFRKGWSLILLTLLIYTGTVFPYRLAFYENRIGCAIEDEDWYKFEILVDAAFWFDLSTGFFFTFRNSKGVEVRRPGKIIWRYLRKGFLTNLIACLPPSVWAPLFGFFFLKMDPVGGGYSCAHGDISLNKVTRLGRLQRMSRMTRLTRMARLTKLFSFVKDNPWWRRFQSLRGVRICNFVVALLWVVHLMACGWYLCAALHANADDTWVGRRVFNDGSVLLERAPLDNWIQAMYFVLTVFTTVGFGDISAETVGEIVFVCNLMLVGAVVHSMIVSEMINVVTTVDHVGQELDRQKDMLKIFASKTDLEPQVLESMIEWVEHDANQNNAGLDIDKIQDLLLRDSLPRSLLKDLPQQVYNGRLLRNKFVVVSFAGAYSVLPPRLPVLLACMVTPHFFESGEAVYFCYEQSWNIFLFLRGVYANVGLLQKEGAVAEIPLSMARLIACRPNKDTKSNLPDCAPRWPVTGNSFRKLSLDPGETIDLYPYQLFGPGSYAGDIEVFLSVLRRTVLRCERRGEALVLGRTHVQRLMVEFPNTTIPWRREVQRRDAFRKRMLERLTRAQTYKDLAVMTIQSYARERMAERMALSSRRTTTSHPIKALFAASWNSMAWRNEAGERFTDMATSNLILDGAASSTASLFVPRDEHTPGRALFRQPSYADSNHGSDGPNYSSMQKDMGDIRAEMRREAEATRKQMYNIQSTLHSLQRDIAKVVASSASAHQVDDASSRGRVVQDI